MDNKRQWAEAWNNNNNSVSTIEQIQQLFHPATILNHQINIRLKVVLLYCKSIVNQLQLITHILYPLISLQLQFRMHHEIFCVVIETVIGIVKEKMTEISQVHNT